MKLAFYEKNNKITLQLNKINIFYGYSNSGKTYFAEKLSEGLSGKDKSFTLNGLTILKEEKNVILINSKESIIDHLKLSSKSSLKRLYYDEIKNDLDNNEALIQNINGNFNEINTKLNNLCDKINDNTSHAKINLNLSISSTDDIIDNFINVEVDSGNLSSSDAKELLFNLLLLTNKNVKETHFIIDDFDAYFDEQTTIHFLNELKEFNGYVYLFTNKPNSILYSLGNTGIFAIRNEFIYDFTNIDYILRKSLESNYSLENQTYEEYMLNYGYLDCSGDIQNTLNKIKINSIINLGRMLTNSTYKITNTIDLNYVSVIPTSNHEELFLKYVDNLLNNR